MTHLCRNGLISWRLMFTLILKITESNRKFPKYNRFRRFKMKLSITRRHNKIIKRCLMNKMESKTLINNSMSINKYKTNHSRMKKLRTSKSWKDTGRDTIHLSLQNFCTRQAAAYRRPITNPHLKQLSIYRKENMAWPRMSQWPMLCVLSIRLLILRAHFFQRREICTEVFIMAISIDLDRVDSIKQILNLKMEMNQIRVKIFTWHQRRSSRHYIRKRKTERSLWTGS